MVAGDLVDKAVVLAAGRGSRMRRPVDAASLTVNQQEVARTGFKAMIPVGRPFIDYLLSGLADAGYSSVCLVVGPDHDRLRNHLQANSVARLDIQFAVQQEPSGTANAVLAAADWVADAPFILLNSDNYYPKSALEELRHAAGPTVVGFRPKGLRRGNISPERLRNFAVLTLDANGCLDRVQEKPADDALFRSSEALISMNCWRFNPRIFDSCRVIPRSVRGEFEITDAVMHAIHTLGERFQVLVVNEPVLDLSTQADIEAVARLLAPVEVRL
jgi:dTDP-glucose pyrophosphorylase